MQPENAPLSTPRRALDVEDYIDIMRRQKAWIIGPAFAGLVLGVVVAFVQPDQYMATGYIRVSPPQVPQNYVQTNIAEDSASRMSMIYQTVTGRGNLINLIQVHKLYPNEVKRLPIEDLAERMRKDIRLSPLATLRGGSAGGRNQGAAYSLSFSYSDRNLAHKVCADLISKFVDDAVRVTTNASLVTTQFMKNQTETAKKELDDIDRKITEFKMKNPSELPEREQMLFARLSGLESTIQNLNLSISRVNSEKLQLEANLRILRDQAVASAQQQGQSVTETGAVVSSSARPADPQAAQLAAANKRIQDLEDFLAGLKQNWKDDHPDVVRVSGQLEALKKQREQLTLEMELARANEPAPSANPSQRRGQPAAPSKETRDLLGALARVQTAIQAKELEAEDLARQLADARNKLREYQAKADGSPLMQNQYLALLQDREAAWKRYYDLYNKLQNSEMGTILVNQRQSETVEILDQPMVPSAPYSPKRELFIAGGLVIGLMLGAGFAGVREIKDSSLKNLKDVRAYTKLTVLGSVPLLESDFVVRRRRRLAWLAWSVSILLGLLMMGGSAFYYFTATGRFL